MTYDKRVSRDLTCIFTICIFFIDGCVCSLVPIILRLAIDLFCVLFTFILEQANVADFMLISESTLVPLFQNESQCKTFHLKMSLIHT